MSRRLTVLVAVLFVFLPAPAFALEDPTTSTVPEPERPPKAWILVDAGTGKVLDGLNFHEPLPPASTAKIVTALVAMQSLTFDTKVPISELAARQPALRISAAAGEEWKFGDLLYSSLLVSANDAAYAIAERAGGNLEGFQELTKEATRKMGMRDSTFNDPAGLDDESAFQDGPRASAYDLAIAARNALAIPELAQIVKLPSYSFEGPDGTPHQVINHNKLIGPTPGANGMKTGYTQRAGRTLIGTATRDGRTMIAVVLDVFDMYGWVQRLFDQGFSTSPNASGIEVLPEPVIQAAETRATALKSIPAVLGRSNVDTAARSVDNTSTGVSTATFVLRASGAMTGALFLSVAGLRIRARRRIARRRRGQHVAQRRVINQKSPRSLRRTQINI